MASEVSKHPVVSREQWMSDRKAFLAKEKEFTRLRDDLSRQRRELPWVKVEKEYVFEGPKGKEKLADLFENRSQLIVYHFMFSPEWDAGCPHCSHWADNFNGVIVHLNHRDVTMVAISRAPYSKLAAYEKLLATMRLVRSIQRIDGETRKNLAGDNSTQGVRAGNPSKREVGEQCLRSVAQGD